MSNKNDPKNIKPKQSDTDTKIVKNNKNIKEEKKKKKKKRKSKVKTFFKIFFLVILLTILAAAGVVAAIIFSDKWSIPEEQLTAQKGAIIYDIDTNIATELSGDEISKKITLDEMAEYLPIAFVSIEDERFYQHSGMDIKRTVSAVASYVVKLGKGNFGGSTITQQLVKNIMDDKARNGFEGMERKVREISRSINLERQYSKDQILEMYLNKIFLGGQASKKNIVGVEKAAQYYFNKTAKDLSLTECAFIAGINHSPNRYDPFAEEVDHDRIKTRTKLVLNKMKELGKIKTEEEYTAAIAAVDAGIVFTKGDVNYTTNISYHTAAAIDQIAKELSEKNDLSMEEARNQVVSSGYKIYTTQNTGVQAALEEEYKKDKYVKTGKKIDSTTGEKQKSQSAMAIIDHKTGYVVAEVGGLRIKYKHIRFK